MVKKNYKYFDGYLYDDYKIKPFHIMLPKSTAYVKSYGVQTKWVYFSIEDDNLLENSNNIWDEVSTDIKKDIDSEPVYSKTFLKTQIESYGDEATDFQDKEMT